MIRQIERETYEQMWAVPAYADLSPGEVCLPVFLDLVKGARGSVLDAGTGSGRGALALQKAGFDVRLCDLTADGLLPAARALPFYPVVLWDDLTTRIGYLRGGKVDYVYCCDVLEHIPPAFTMLVIRRLLDVTRRGLFLSITLQPDQFGVWVGKPLHQSVQAFGWWRDAIAEIGTLVECRDLLSSGIYWVQP